MTTENDVFKVVDLRVYPGMQVKEDLRTYFEQFMSITSNDLRHEDSRIRLLPLIEDVKDDPKQNIITQRITSAEGNTLTLITIVPTMYIFAGVAGHVIYRFHEARNKIFKFNTTLLFLDKKAEKKNLSDLRKDDWEYFTMEFEPTYSELYKYMNPSHKKMSTQLGMRIMSDSVELIFKQNAHINNKDERDSVQSHVCLPFHRLVVLTSEMSAT
ncbi:hypothetical protein ACFE04_006365 [Oxalis oulophora]